MTLFLYPDNADTGTSLPDDDEMDRRIMRQRQLERIQEIQADVDTDRLVRAALDNLNQAQQSCDDAERAYFRAREAEKIARHELSILLEAMDVIRIVP